MCFGFVVGNSACVCIAIGVCVAIVVACVVVVSKPSPCIVPALVLRWTFCANVSTPATRTLVFKSALLCAATTVAVIEIEACMRDLSTAMSTMMHRWFLPEAH